MSFQPRSNLSSFSWLSAKQFVGGKKWENNPNFLCPNISYKTLHELFLENLVPLWDMKIHKPWKVQIKRWIRETPEGAVGTRFFLQKVLCLYISWYIGCIDSKLNVPQFWGLSPLYVPMLIPMLSFFISVSINFFPEETLS